MNASQSQRNEILNPGSKRLEIGYLNARNPLTVYIIAECFPVWLLSLDASWCCGLTLVGATSLEVFLLPFSQGLRDMLLLLLEPFIRNSSLSFCSRIMLRPEVIGSPETLLLISGCIFEFMLPLLEQFQTHNLCGVCDTHYSGRLRRGRPTANDSTISSLRLERLNLLAWHRCKHSIPREAQRNSWLCLFTINPLSPHSLHVSREGLDIFLLQAYDRDRLRRCYL